MKKIDQYRLAYAIALSRQYTASKGNKLRRHGVVQHTLHELLRAELKQKRRGL